MAFTSNFCVCFLIILCHTNIICNDNDECYCNDNKCTFECNNCLNSKIYCNISTNNNSNNNYYGNISNNCTINCVEYNSCNNITIYTEHPNTLILNKHNESINIVCQNNTDCCVNCLNDNQIMRINHEYPMTTILIQRKKPLQPFWHYIMNTETKIVLICILIIIVLMFISCILFCFIWHKKFGSNNEYKLPSPKAIEIKHSSTTPTNITPSSGPIKLTPNNSVIIQNGFIYMSKDISSKTGHNSTPTITPTHSNVVSMTNFNKSIIFPIPSSRMHTPHQSQMSRMSNIIDDNNISDIESTIPDLPFNKSSQEIVNLSDIIHDKKNESVNITLNQIYNDVFKIDEDGILHELSETKSSNHNDINDDNNDDMKTSNDNTTINRDVSMIDKFDSEELYDMKATETPGETNT